MAALPFLEGGKNRGGTITATGVAQQVAAANDNRRFLTIQNTGFSDLWFDEVGNAAVAGSPSYRLCPGATAKIGTNLAVSIIGTAGGTFSATEG